MPRLWASNANYSAGPDIGTPTKVDPGVALTAEGIEPGGPVDAQHLNHILNAMTAAERRAVLLQALQLRAVGTLQSGTEQNIGVCTMGSQAGLLCTKSSGTQIVYDWAHAAVGGTLATAFTKVFAAASNGSLVAPIAVVVGDNVGNDNDVSLDNGQTWNAGTAGMANVCTRIVYNSHWGFFHACGNAGAAVSRVDDPSSNFWVAPGSFFAANEDIACLADGTIVLLDHSTSGGIKFAKSVDNGTNYSAAGGTVANATAGLGPGSLVGYNGALVYHATLIAGGDLIQISASANGTSWSTTAQVQTHGGCTAPVRLYACQETGLLVLIAKDNRTNLPGSVLKVWASLDGVDWIGPLSLAAAGLTVDSFGVAGGRLVGTAGGFVLASDGIGFGV